MRGTLAVADQDHVIVQERSDCVDEYSVLALELKLLSQNILTEPECKADWQIACLARKTRPDAQLQFRPCRIRVFCRDIRIRNSGVPPAVIATRRSENPDYIKSLASLLEEGSNGMPEIVVQLVCTVTEFEFLAVTVNAFEIGETG